MQKLQHVQYHCQSKLLKKLQLYVRFDLYIKVHIFVVWHFASYKFWNVFDDKRKGNIMLFSINSRSCSLRHERTIILLSKEMRGWASHRGQIFFPSRVFSCIVNTFCLSIYRFFSINMWGRFFSLKYIPG
jgi:hypothetical protein